MPRLRMAASGPSRSFGGFVGASAREGHVFIRDGPVVPEFRHVRHGFLVYSFNFIRAVMVCCRAVLPKRYLGAKTSSVSHTDDFKHIRCFAIQNTEFFHMSKKPMPPLPTEANVVRDDTFDDDIFLGDFSKDMGDFMPNYTGRGLAKALGEKVMNKEPMPPAKRLRKAPPVGD